MRSNDIWWKPIVKMAMMSADAIVADLSDVADGTAWELDQIDDLRLHDKVVFVALEERLSEARAALNRYHDKDAAKIRVFTFDPAGRTQDDVAFVDNLLDAIARSVHISGRQSGSPQC